VPLSKAASSSKTNENICSTRVYVQPTTSNIKKNICMLITKPHKPLKIQVFRLSSSFAFGKPPME
jgi:hypothetical protein